MTTLRCNSCSSLFSNLLFITLVSGCGASGAAAPGTGGANVTTTNTGSANGIGGNTSPGAGGNAGNGGATTNPALGGGVATGGAVGLGGGAVTGGAVGLGGGATTGGAPPATGGAPPCVPGTPIGAAYSTNYFVLAFPQLSPFYVFNNGWSTTSTSLTTAGTQEDIAAFDTCTPGTISWKTTYNWSGANNTVKAYPSAILGWQNTKGFRYDATVTGLPKTISTLSSAKCSWTYTLTGGAAQNVSFDIWVHNTACNSTGISLTTTPSDEIMIWLYSSGGVNPIGCCNGTQVTLSGATWTLYTGSNGSSTVHSFVRSGNSQSVQNLDILAFLNNLNLGTKCLSSIEAGTEVFTGSGSLMTNSYSCAVQ